MAGAMIKMLAAYGLTLVAFAAIDAVWLINMAPRLYKPEIGEVMMENGFRLTPAMIFYAIYIGGIDLSAQSMVSRFLPSPPSGAMAVTKINSEMNTA
jgi:uncharacterized membrane protein